MSMFQKSVINRYLAGIGHDQIEVAYQNFKADYTSAKIAKIKRMKEEEYQDGFLRDIFVNSLGYTLKPDDDYNLAREFKNLTDGKKADGAIVKNGMAIAVIELKSTKTKELKSITEQAFNYKNNQPGCKCVITSNFQKLRFYMDYANEYEEFDLFRLSKEDFELLYLILSKESIFKDIPQKIKKDSISHQENVSKQLYKDYSFFKNKLFENLVKNNPLHDKLTLFGKSQKLIDRFLFILFAEDKGLLPPNSLTRIIQRFDVLKEEDAYKPLYDIYKQYFGYMNIGRKGKNVIDDIPAYNGGLFHADEILDNLKIDDDILINDLNKLSVYDFDTEVDVNILGQIFEHSLSAIEEVTAQIKGISVDKTKSKRKKDGIFYTPEYITQYIVENTVGRLCEEKRQELDIAEIEFDESYLTQSGRLSKKGKALYQKLEDYKNWLLSLKIIDPACGSGAFLNQALNFLINEHKFIVEIQTDLQEGQISMFNIEKAVLENNLYGVDINEESVEITKLSLWLRTAHKKRKLSALSDNIKCGNSLIDDPEVAGDKAFDWQNEFPDIFAKGGFDVVIGNPPYLSGREWSEELNAQRTYFIKNFSCMTDQYDLYALFIQRCNTFLKKKGYYSFIVPATWFNNAHYQKLRKWVLGAYKILLIGDFRKVNVFKDATVLTAVFVFSKEEYNYLKNTIVIESFNTPNLITSMITTQDIWMKSETNIFNLELSLSDVEILQKISKNSTPLSKLGIVRFGVKVYQKGKGKPKQDGTEAPVKKFESFEKLDDSYIEYLHGKDITPYSYKLDLTYLKYGLHLAEPRAIDLFKNGRVLIRRIVGQRLIVCPLFETMIADQLIHTFKPHSDKDKDKNNNYKGIACILGSSLIAYYFRKTYNRTEKTFPEIRVKELSSLPIIYRENFNILEPYADQMISKNKELQELKDDFLNFLKSELKPQKITKKLANWPDSDWDQFKKELAKGKVKIKALSLKERKEWQEYFTEEKQKTAEIKSVIENTDREIDLMVYELYGLTREEIKIVENVS